MHLVPRFPSCGRGQYLYHVSTRQIVKRFKNLLEYGGVSRETSVAGEHSVYQEYLEQQAGDECGKKPKEMWHMEGGRN